MNRTTMLKRCALGLGAWLLANNATAACNYRVVDYFAPPASDYAKYINQGGYRLSLCNEPHGPKLESVPCNRIALKGYMHLPHPLNPRLAVGLAPDVANTYDHDLPLVIWVDGSMANPDNALLPNPNRYPEGCAVGSMLRGKGFAMLAVVRRGYYPSTGENADVFHAHLTGSKVENDLRSLDYVSNQSFEVQEAINFMLRQKNRNGQRLVDPGKVAILGHSIGGIVTLFFGNLGNQGPIIDAGIPSGKTQAKVKVLFSPSEESWDGFDREDSGIFDSTGGFLDDTSPSLDRLKLAAQHSVLPMYFLGPLNDANTRSVVVLSKAAGDWQLGEDDGDPFNDPEPNYSLNRACRLRILLDNDPSLSANERSRKIVDTCPLPREVQSALFPVIPLTSDLDDNGDPVQPTGHGPFIVAPAQIAKWSPSVLDFLARYGVAP